MAWFRASALLLTTATTALLTTHCGDNAPVVNNGVTTENCTYLDMLPTSGAGGMVQAGPLTAGAAESILDIPVGTALGGYTARDYNRKHRSSGGTNLTFAPMVKRSEGNAATTTGLMLGGSF